MKFYGPKEMVKREKRNVYKILRQEGLSEYKSRKVLSDIYSLKGELFLKPSILGAMFLMKKWNWLSKEEFHAGLESLVN